MDEAAARGEIVVKRRLEAVAEVRGFVRLTLGRWEVDDEVPCLVASELVTNAIRYGTTADDEVTVRLSRADGGALWLEVQDTSGDVPHVCAADANSESGRGLFIVERVARHWGVRPLAGGAGKVVFAVLDP
ncbi:ATP-binding protein [Actinomadura craniellae]|uniref:ATP-binding protein n=1 Tax=Actinomadura craniellae TaxID=2231787 RepID=A0A365H029_9ACTN|nr:ATP-binding protein [Actinomadura craniellae]RAY12421.1 ATP-binding protein [Actinomadura craniellae]